MQRMESSNSELEAPITIGHHLHTVMIGEQLLESDYLVHEIPTGSDEATEIYSKTVNTALLAHRDV